MMTVRSSPHDRFKILSCLASALIVGWGFSTGVFAQDAEPTDAEPAPPSISSPRDLLRGHGIDDDQFANLTDGQPVGGDETETLRRIIYWMRDFPAIDVENWARAELNLAELAENPDPDRGQIFAFSGRVTLAEVRPLEAKEASRFEMKQYYRCRLLLDGRQPAVVYSQNVPKAWPKNKPIDQPVGAFGLFLKFGEKENDRAVPVFVAPRIAWYPDTMLGNLGMDVGLLEDLQNKHALGDRDREPFYQMLAAVGRTKPGQLLRDADQLLAKAPKEQKRADGKEFSVAPLFNKPDQQRGRLVVLTGNARRVVRIRVDDPDVVTRFKIDHYYEMAIYTDDSQDNPIFFCVRELPKGMPTGDGPDFGVHVRVAGFFFKSWGYRSDEPGRGSGAGGQSSRQRRLAPLLIGRRPLWYGQVQSGTSPWIGAIAGGLFVLALLGIWVALWQYGRGDKEFYDRTIGKSHSLEAGISLDEIGLHVDGTPDFSRLEQMECDTAQKRDDA